MALRVPTPELSCIDPENYRQYFRALCWSGTRKNDKKTHKKIGKKDKFHRLKAGGTLTICYAPALLGNPSQFAVYATVRRSILARWRNLQSNSSEASDDSDNEEGVSPVPINKLPKITGVGLRTVFSLISQAKITNPHFCEQALKALLDVLQGHSPEELSQEPTDMIFNIHSMLVEVSSGVSPSGRSEHPSKLTALSSSCLIALSVARGEAELILNAAASLAMCAPLYLDQYLKTPANLTTLQRSVQSVILGSPSRNQWLQYGVPSLSLINSFPVDLPVSLTSGSGDLVVRSLVSDGCYLYVFTSKGLLKIGSGYGSSIKQHVYSYKPDFFAGERHGWLGYCRTKLFVRIGRKKTDIYEIDRDTLEVRQTIKLDPGLPAPIESKSAVFSDGNQIGLILLTKFDTLTIRMYSVDTASRQEGTNILTSQKEFNVHLLRRRTLVMGRAPFEDILPRRPLDMDVPVATQLDDNDDDPLLSICGGQEFGLLATVSGKVYYCGKGSSLGYKAASANTKKWTLMKETTVTKNEAPNAKKAKIAQVAVGHEGVHAILVLDNGTALFTGVARRGEDGDAIRHRRTPKPTRPKKIFKAEGHHIVYAACNYGSTALVTRQGLLLMFGKDTLHCDSSGLVLGLRHERVIQVALGKAHAVVLTSFGLVYTLGINNKGQCGREFGYTKEKPSHSRHHDENKDEARICQTPHSWTTDYCRVCVLCCECTGFSNACHCSHLPNRVPGEKCGCGEGDSGCSVCGICRRCADAFAAAGRAECTERVSDADDDADAETSTAAEAKNDPEPSRYTQYEGHSSGLDDRDTSFKVSCLPPARVAVPGGHRVAAVACGLHHTVLLTEHGEVLTFGSNQFGQLGAGDISTHHRIIRVKVPKASAIAAGSNHTAVLTRDGELFTFGSYQKGSLGRPCDDDAPRSERGLIWYATPGRVPRLGPRYSCKAVWISASGDQTFVQISQALIKTDTLFSSTITSNNNCILILPNRPEHTFKCLTINKNDGTCNAWTGSEQVDFVNTLACLDPLYDVLWCYHPQVQVIRCYNILAFDAHKIQRCCNNDPDGYDDDNDFDYPSCGNMRRLEDFKNLESFEVTCSNEEKPTDIVALVNMSVLSQELAIPCAPKCSITRMHAVLHLLACLDSLNYAHDNKLSQVECKRDNASAPEASMKEDFLTVNRFESHGGGWGYSGHSVEAIRFMCDTDILLGGYGLFGGRGDYTAKIKLYDIGLDGGDQEADGELLAESDEIVFECAPRDRFPVLFETPVPIVANRWYLAWACMNGPSSDCGSSGQAMVINDEVGFHFKSSKKSNNGTDVNAGQIPCLLYNIATPDHNLPMRITDPGEPIIPLSKNISRKVTVPCFRSLISLLTWGWASLKEFILDTNGQIPITYQKLLLMKQQKRLVYVVRSCLRLVKFYINEIYPQNNRKRNSHEYMSYFESIGEVRNLIQMIMADCTPTCSRIPRRVGRIRSSRVCYVQFALELMHSVFNEAHDTVTACFHAFFPTPTLKWNHMCSLLFYVKEGTVPPAQIRELTATCAAMCVSRSLRDVLQYIVPVTQNYLITHENKRPDSKVVVKEMPLKSATVPRSSYAQKPPPIPPRTGNMESPKFQETTETKQNFSDWHLLDVITKLLDIVLLPIKRQMMTRPCNQPHDHGEIKQHERLAEFCCKLTVRIVAELTHSTANIRDDVDSSSVKHLVTPSRFMRVNQSRAWNTGNGSPDAICFTVDRSGVMLVGVCVYGGPGNYEYSIELLNDVRQSRSSPEEMNPAHCWVSVEVAHGAFSGAECQHDMVQLKFDRPILLKEEIRYAIRLCNHGGRTANGDCGLPSVKGPDGTTFRFASCSLSFNGTTLARGQIPCLVYYSRSSTTSLCSSESTDSLVTALRTITLRVASLVMERGSELFCTLRNELTAEDLKRNASVLQQSPAINTLIPYTLASLDGLDDPKSVIKILEMIRKLLPHVGAMNLLVPSVEETNINTTAAQYYSWVESEHPYKQATVTNMRVLFPTTVSWIVLEMDPRSITAQPEDTLTVFAVAGAPKHKCHCTEEPRTDIPFKKRLVHLGPEGDFDDYVEAVDTDAPCMQYNCTYVSVTPKLSNVATEWPQRSLLVPGNEVIFSLETASDYLTEYNKANNEENRFGFRCLAVGYEDSNLTSQKQGLVALEMDLMFTGAACASKLLAPDLEIPPMSFATLLEVQLQAMIGGNPTGGEDETPQDACETLFLSRGLDLTSLPTVHQIFDDQSLQQCISTERQFLSDFVGGDENTAGGRLARWLAPTSRVEPNNCELKAPAVPARPATRVILPVLVRDQYGDYVASPALKVEVVVQRLEGSGARASRASGPGNDEGLPDIPYQPTVRDNMCFQAISMMKAYQNFSFEEIRFTAGAWGRSMSNAVAFGGTGRSPAERLTVRQQLDGTFYASWTPRSPGTYVFKCTLDDLPVPNELTIDVVESTYVGPAERGAQPLVAGQSSPSSRVRSFTAENSAGLRVRASPSLQSEELGRIPPGENIMFVEEVVNKDGTWVRLSLDCANLYAEESSGVAWCLQHNRHLDRILLEPVEPSSPIPEEEEGGWRGAGEMRDETLSWSQDEDCEGAAADGPSGIDHRLPLTELNDDSDSGSSAIAQAMELCKRNQSREDLCSSPSSAIQRRSNGNNDDWWPPSKRSSDNFRDVDTILETDIEPDGDDSEQDKRCGSRMAQAGTQTSPESVDDMLVPVHLFATGPKDGRVSPMPVPRERTPARSRPYRRASPPPPPPSRSVPAPPPPKKHALSPAQAETLRCIFAALLWHEGIVHDAIACAAFLKFHPQLPKQGTRVVTRSSHDFSLARNQRHSVEVSNAGQYLNINPSTLETLTRSGIEASESRARKADVDVQMNEDYMQPQCSTSTDPVPPPAVVNVLPPALRALVALWDALYDADQLSATTEKNKRGVPQDKTESEELRPLLLRIKRDLARRQTTKTPYVVQCELCGGSNVPPPLAAHMRHAHPGCRAVTLHGYDRAGTYREAEPQAATADTPVTACGQLAQAYELWYIYCERCREKTLKAKSKSAMNMSTERLDMIPGIDHNVMKENALFLLDLAPLTDSEPLSVSPWSENLSRSPPTSPGSVWQPAPPFQCLQALGAEPKENDNNDAAKYHSLGRPQPPAIAPTVSNFAAPEASLGFQPRVHRSVSMGQAGGDLAAAARPLLTRKLRSDSHDTATGSGLSLLSQPSKALKGLLSCGDWSATDCPLSAFEAPRIDSNIIMKRPVLSFVLAKRDLAAHREKMDAAVRINIVRQYAFEALNWLLRSATQPICAHDVMWWFCTALEKFARIVPPPHIVEDNKENAVAEPIRTVPPTASTSAICPGGRAARGARAAFHSFLGSVSTLAPSLPHASAASLQAIRCWALHYSSHDRAFLHRSQVFSVISKILSRSEEGVHDDGPHCAIHDSFHSYLKENHVWSSSDVTGWCDITVSSRQGMAGALTDGSTETFWESGDEDRNKAKWIQISYPGGSHDDRPHIVCVHIDNTRDTVNKTLLMTFLYSSGSTELIHMQDIEVDPKVATWLCYTLPRVSTTSLRVRCELRGPEAAVRIRQVRVLSAPTLLHSAAVTAPQVLHGLCETDTLRVFRLLTSQVFGKLLEWEQSSDAGAEAAVAIDDGVANDDSDLREHVVGILFAGHKLTSLQRQVMSHIVSAIGCETARVRDDWETTLLCVEPTDSEWEESPAAKHMGSQQDNYCFEMLSLLLALSGSAVGRVHLAQRTELLSDLLSLLHTGSERVQRQVISLLRRLVIELPPQKMLAAVNYGSDPISRVTLLDHLVCYLGKAITVQMKVKGSSGAAPATVMMGGSMVSLSASNWFMRGETTKKHAHLVAKLLSDMAEDKLAGSWGLETRTQLANYVCAISQVSEKERQPALCIASPTIWMALASLCVCEQSHLDLVNSSGDGRGARGRDSSSETRPLCANHDDGATAAVIDCRNCGPLCAECDRFLHLNRTARTHHRQICKEEESAIRIDIHEGCGRAKLFWLLLLVDRRTLKALAEFRGMEGGVCEAGPSSEGPAVASGPVAPSGTCRFCGARESTGILTIGNICADQQCQDHGREACNVILACGHLCGGVRGEQTCLPCLHGCAGVSAGEAAPLRQDADDMCMICFTDPLQAAPAIQLTCGHVFHLHCCRKVLVNKWNGPRISFSFSQCPICKEDINHWTLEELLTPIRQLRDEVKRKALMRLEYEGLSAPGGTKGRNVSDPASYAMDRYAYYVCHKCGKAYFGGLARCEAESNGWWEPAELVCGACSDVTGARTCPKHGADFLEYKCRYCCSVAVFFCFGTSHFCNACHDDFQRVTHIPRHLLPQCPAGPKGEQLPGTSDECPLHVQHPATGEEFALGCGVCRHAQGF
ncbi:E3 ubiquitin-protein ligase MYCBP2 isoform X2 [Bombyx mandarina]|uniref:RCR-type E3 ubiquitin transferase n=1 Tax=Bombyx mandarina TaxID=7092 RepID=A0A6J2KLQ1_BOMMA|nr:E3 ubiquitin-protein ligase MYCBP2 isoform X2 [Bombyx mandarina]